MVVSCIVVVQHFVDIISMTTALLIIQGLVYTLELVVLVLTQLFGESDNCLCLTSKHHHVGPVPARYVRQSQLCPQLDMSDKNCNKKQDMSDRARYVRQKLQQKTQDMSDRARDV